MVSDASPCGSERSESVNVFTILGSVALVFVSYGVLCYLLILDTTTKKVHVVNVGGC